jgi:hypothetical protein
VPSSQREPVIGTHSPPASAPPASGAPASGMLASKPASDGLDASGVVSPPISRGVDVWQSQSPKRASRHSRVLEVPSGQVQDCRSPSSQVSHTQAS